MTLAPSHKRLVDRFTLQPKYQSKRYDIVVFLFHVKKVKIPYGLGVRNNTSRT